MVEGGRGIVKPGSSSWKWVGWGHLQMGRLGKKQRFIGLVDSFSLEEGRLDL